MKMPNNSLNAHTYGLGEANQFGLHKMYIIC